ncbi:MFS transporter [bacterium]|nr:MFS transporter [bacterium]
MINRRSATLPRILTALFLSVFGFATTVPLLSLYAREMGAGEAGVGILLAIYPLIDLLLAPLVGRLSDRWGRRPVLLVAQLCFTLGWGTLALADSVWMFALSQLLTGLGSTQITITYAYVADVTPPEKRTRGMGLFGMVFAGSFVLGPPLGGALSSLHGAAPAALAAGFTLLAFLFTYLRIDEPPRREQNVRDLPKRAGLNRIIVALIALYAVIVFMETQITAMFGLYAQDLYGWGKRETGMFFGLFGLTGALVQGVAAGRLAGRFGRPFMILSGFLFALVGMLGMTLAGVFADGPAWVYGGVIAAALGYGLLVPSISSLVSLHAPRRLQGQVLGVLQAAASLSRVLAPAVGGLLYQRIAPYAPYGLATILALVGFFAALAGRRAFRVRQSHVEQ